MAKSFYLCNEKNKHIPTTRKLIRSAIKEFLLYMSNDDIELIEKLIQNIKIHRAKEQVKSNIEVEKHSWPYPDTIVKHEVKN